MSQNTKTTKPDSNPLLEEIVQLLATANWEESMGYNREDGDGERAYLTLKDALKDIIERYS